MSGRDGVVFLTPYNEKLRRLERTSRTNLGWEGEREGRREGRERGGGGGGRRRGVISQCT